MTGADHDDGPSRPTATLADFLTTFGVVLGLIVALLALDLSLARIQRNEARQHAAHLYAEGRTALAAGLLGEAADRLSTAVSLERTNVDYALALAQTILALGRTADAEQMLGDLLERAQNDGPVNLTMARLLASTHRPRDAMAFYHRAVYGRWGADSNPQRLAVRFELIGLLSRERARTELLAELLPLQSPPSDSTAMLARIGPLYLQAGAPNRAAEVFRALARRSPDNPAAYIGIGDAALALGQLLTARSAFRNAARAAPLDSVAAAKLQLADTLLALDPTARGLGDRERLRRSRAVLARTLAARDLCAPEIVAPTERAAQDSAIRAVRARERSSQSDPASTAEQMLLLAGAIWRSHVADCAQQSPNSEAITLLQRLITS